MESSASGEIRVWDLSIRLFHWSLVFCFALAYITGEAELFFHSWPGYVILGLLAYRVMWGLVGTRYARFSDFVKGPAETLRYLRSLLSRHPIHYYGHNPAGGWMVVLLLLVIAVTVWSGVELEATEGRGLLAGEGVTLVSPAQAKGDDRRRGAEHEWSEAAGEWWEEVHEAAAGLALALVVIHLLGVIVSSVLHRENLVWAMLTGKKPTARAQPPMG